MRRIFPSGSSAFWLHLTGLCAAVALPLLLLSGLLLFQAGEAERSRLEAEARAKARSIALVIEREVEGMIGIGQTLAASETLREGRLDVFDPIAREIARLNGSTIVLRTLEGRQILNTAVPRGQPLPPATSPEIRVLDEQAVRTGKPQVSDLVIGPVSKRSLFVVDVAVPRQGEEPYILAVVRPVERLRELALQTGPPEGWWVTVFDRTGTIMTRTLPTDLTGKKGVPEALQAIRDGRDGVHLTSPEGVRNYAAFSPVNNVGWTVAVAVGNAVLLAPLYRFLGGTALIMAAAFALSGALAVIYGRRISRGVTGLTRAVEALGRGEPVGRPTSAVREIDDAGQALEITAAELDQRGRQRNRLLTEAQAAVAAKSRFLAAASHDLRQPLQALNLYIQVLNQRTGQRDAAVFDKIDTCLARLSAMLNELLDLSKLDSGMVAAKMSDFAVSDLLDALSTATAALAADKNIALRHVPCHLVVHSDPLLLERIVGNLLSNAVRYTEPGGAILLGCRRRGDLLWIEVWDTGIGIPEDKFDLIFEEFMQLGNPERSRDQGTGLGLAIVRKSAQLIGAEIRLTSRLGRGSTFAVGVPLARLAKAAE